MGKEKGIIVNLYSIRKNNAVITKGQLITKCPFVAFNSPKKRTNKIDCTTVVPQVEFFSVVFWEN